MPPQRKVALITGGARGIGLGIAQSLAAEGLDLALCGLRPPEAVAATLEALRAQGTDVQYVQANVADSEARKRLVAAVREHFGRLHVLVNNAGVAPEVRADLLEATEESYDRVMGINLKGPYFLTQAVARWMVEQTRQSAEYRASIINISSVSATMISTARGEYCLSKAGIAMATQLWAVRLGEFGIPVYEVRPGLVKTDMTRPATEKYDKLIASGLCVQNRWGLPEDVGRAVAMLVRGDLPYSTGQVVAVDGGMTLQRL